MGYTSEKRELVVVEEKVLTFFNKSCGINRFVYNQGLSCWNYLYEEHLKDPEQPKPRWQMIANIFNAEKDQFYPWMREVSCYVIAGSLANLGTAWANYFRDLKSAKAKSKKTKRPKFKKKGKRDSFAISNNDLKIIDNRTIRIPKIGQIKTKEDLNVNGKIMSAVISRTANKWFIAINYEIPDKKKVAVFDEKTGKILPCVKKCGVKLGINSLATLSTKQKFVAPKPIKHAKRKLAKLQRKLSRQTRRGKNYKKTKLKIQRLNMKIANKRKDFTHKMTTNIVKKNDIICLETLNVGGMLKNHKLAGALIDVSLSEVIRQVKYKAEREGKWVQFIDQFFPSTKQCRSVVIRMRI